MQSCQYDYQLVSGSLDSYPVVSSSTCYMNSICGTASNTPCYIAQDYTVTAIIFASVVFFVSFIAFLFIIKPKW